MNKTLSKVNEIYNNLLIKLPNVITKEYIQVYLTNQGSSMGKDSTIDYSMTYTVIIKKIIIKYSMIKKKKNN